MDAILEVAKRHNIAVIEDAAEAVGTEPRGERHPVCLGATCRSHLAGRLPSLILSIRALLPAVCLVVRIVDIWT